MFRYVLPVSLSLGGGLGGIYPARAAEGTLVPSLALSSRSFEYSSGSARVEGDLLSLGVALTGIWGRFYADLSLERNPTAGEDTSNTLVPREIEINRQDTSLALGYAVNDSISVFTGYKYGKTTLSLPGTLSVRELATSLEGRGPYVGAGGGWQIKDWGMLSFSAAYARLDATFENYLGSSVSGSASGTSLSLEWKAPLIKQMYYELGLVHHDYFYQDFGAAGFDVTERILSFKAGLSYRF